MDSVAVTAAQRCVQNRPHCTCIPRTASHFFSFFFSFHSAPACTAMACAAVDIIRAHRDVKGIRRIRGRRNGPAVLLDCELAVPPGISVGAAEEIASTIRGSVYRERREVAEMLINFVPADEADHIDAHPHLPGGAAAHAINSSAMGGAGTAGAAAAGSDAKYCGHGHGHGSGAAADHHHDDDDHDHDHDHDHDGHGHSHGAESGSAAGAGAALARFSMHELQEMVRSALLTGSRPTFGGAATSSAAPTVSPAPAAGKPGGRAGASSSGTGAPSSGIAVHHLRAITSLDVHPEADASRALHVHARLALDPSVPLREALATVRRLQAVLRGMKLPIHKAADGSAVVASGASADEGCWEVLVADVQLETESL